MNNETIHSYKGFDKNLRCLDFQYEIGKEYETDKAEACKTGFHACEQPIDVFHHYAPATSRYCEVEQSGELSRDSDDSKVASTKIKIDAEIGIPGIVKAQIEYVKSKTTTEYTDPERATAGDSGAATSRGSSATGENGLSVARGNNVRVKGGIGALLVLCEENESDYGIAAWKCAAVDGESIKADTWYKLVDGGFAEDTEK